jgi:hypothetical protein
MPPEVESFVQVLPDSTGKKVRNLQLDVLQPDGTVSTVMMQVVSIVDNEGRVVNPARDDTVNVLRDVLAELRGIRRELATAHGNFLSRDGDA